MANVLIFCSSSSKVSPMFFSEIGLVARGLAERGHTLIYGGAQVGLMGHMANEALKLGGEVTGVIPDYLNKPDIVHHELTTLEVVSTLMDRKRAMIEKADVVMAFPGGMGTIDELTEAVSLKQLDQLHPPIIVHNFMDFWKPMLSYFEELRQHKMISQDLEDLFTVTDGYEDFFAWLDDQNFLENESHK